MFFLERVRGSLLKRMEIHTICLMRLALFYPVLAVFEEDLAKEMRKAGQRTLMGDRLR
jgi:hypothetical protein